MRKVIILLLIATIGKIDADQTNAGAFLRNGMEPKSIAMGGSVTAIAEGSDSVYWNPAGLSNKPKQDLQFMVSNAYETHFSQLETQLLLPNPKNKKKKIPLGIMVKRAWMDGIDETVQNEETGRYEKTGKSLKYEGLALYLASSRRVTKKMAIGITGKYLEESEAGYKGTGWGADVGIQYRPIDHVSLGLTARNVLQPVMVWNTESRVKEAVPREYVVGGAYKLFRDKLTLSNDVGFRDNRHPVWRMGGEFRITDIVPVWIGSNDGELSLGTGIETEKISVMLSWTNPKQHIVENVYKFGIRFGI